MARINMDFEVDGEQQLSRFFDVMGDEIEDFSDIFRGWAKDFRERQHSVFSNEGAFEGRLRWEELSPDYKAWKDLFYPGARILERTQRLWDSLVSTGHADHISEISEKEFKIGTAVPYAIWHQRGTERMPQRKIIELTEPQRTDWTQICRRTVWEKMEAEAGRQDIQRY